MRPLALLLALPLAACGGGEGEGGACADAIVRGDDVYLGTPLTGPALTAGDPVEAVRPGCNDGGGFEPDSAQSAREITGIPPEVALLRGRGGRYVYVNTHFFVELPSHPLHERLAVRGRRRAWTGRHCTVTGRVTDTTWGLTVEAKQRDWRVAVGRRTAIVGFERLGLPYLDDGDAVRIRGRRCRDGQIAAERIEPQR